MYQDVHITLSITTVIEKSLIDVSVAVRTPRHYSKASLISLSSTMSV